jgi:hypothetical protein
MGTSILLNESLPERFACQFHQDDSSYSFRGSFAIEADIDCLLIVMFEIDHISKFATGTKAVELIQQGEDWNVVRYTYRRFIFFENSSTCLRTLDRDSLELAFEMIKSENNLGMVPEMLSSRGHYRIGPDDEGHRLEYFQECKLNPGDVTASYIKTVEEETMEFLNEFWQYINRTCADHCHDE